MYGRPAQSAHLIHLQFLFLNRELNWFHFSCPGWRLQWVLGRSIGSHHFWLEFLASVLWQGKEDPLALHPGWAAPGLDPQELQELKISWAHYCLCRSSGKASSSPRRWHCPVSGAWSCCHWPLLNSHTHSSIHWKLGCLGLKGSLFIPGPVFHLVSSQESGLQAGAGLGRWPRVTSHLFPSILCCHKFIPARCG